MRIMALDLGKKRIGVAISDELSLIAQPLCLIKRTSVEKDLLEILKTASEYNPSTIVVGVPYNMDGSAGVEAEKAFRFIALLKEKSSLAIEGWDERLSTVAVERVLIEADVSRGRRKGVIDKLAASYILQGWLERHRAGGGA